MTKRDAWRVLVTELATDRDYAVNKLAWTWAGRLDDGGQAFQSVRRGHRITVIIRDVAEER